MELSRRLAREKQMNLKEYRKSYKEKHKIVYRINIRDVNRLRKKNLIPEGYEVHHLKYHSDVNDETWIDDILILPRAEHRAWHSEHPEFNALENVV